MTAYIFKILKTHSNTTRQIKMHPISQSASTASPSEPCKPKAAVSPTNVGYANLCMTRQISMMSRKRSGPGSSSEDFGNLKKLT